MLSKDNQISLKYSSKLKSFDELKTSEAAAIILKLSGGAMPNIKLITLLYLADRKAYQDWERPITYDTFVSTKNGPALRSTYDLLQNKIKGEYWNRHITSPNGHSIQLKENSPEIQALSKAEIELLHGIFEEYGHYEAFKLAEYAQNLPEFKGPENSSNPINVPDLLEALNYSIEDINRIISELQEEAGIAAVFGN